MGRICHHGTGYCRGTGITKRRAKWLKHTAIKLERPDIRQYYQCAGMPHKLWLLYCTESAGYHP